MTTHGTGKLTVSTYTSDDLSCGSSTSKIESSVSAERTIIYLQNRAFCELTKNSEIIHAEVTCINDIKCLRCQMRLAYRLEGGKDMVNKMAVLNIRFNYEDDKDLKVPVKII